MYYQRNECITGSRSIESQIFCHLGSRWFELVSVVSSMAVSFFEWLCPAPPSCLVAAIFILSGWQLPFLLEMRRVAMMAQVRTLEAEGLGLHSSVTTY